MLFCSISLVNLKNKQTFYPTSPVSPDFDNPLPKYLHTHN